MRRSVLIASLLAVLQLLSAAPHGLCQVDAETTAAPHDDADAQSTADAAATAAHEDGFKPRASDEQGPGFPDTFDIAGPCKEAVESYCSAESRAATPVAKCLSDQIDREAREATRSRDWRPDFEEGEAEASAPVSAACRQDVTRAKMRILDLTSPSALELTACRGDVAERCSWNDLLGYPRTAVDCLRTLKPQLSTDCRQQLTDSQIAAADDFRLNAQLHDACKDSAAKLCQGVEPGGARVHTCLRRQIEGTTRGCQEQLFKADVDAAADVRLNSQLIHTCAEEQSRFCGDTNALRCLEDARTEPGFGKECRDAVEALLVLQAGDYRLDAPLREACREDIDLICRFERRTLEVVHNSDARVIECLQDYRDELTRPECAVAVYATVVRAADDIRFARSLSEACFDDRRVLCRDVTTSSAGIQRCLQDHLGALTEDCRVILFDHQVRVSESVDMQPSLKQACSREVSTLCSAVPARHALDIRCLQDHRTDARFGAPCRQQLAAFETWMLRDYRLNYALSVACENPILRLCGAACDLYSGTACGGSVLRCLVEKKDAVADESCRAEVQRLLEPEGAGFVHTEEAGREQGSEQTLAPLQTTHHMQTHPSPAHTVWTGLRTQLAAMWSTWRQSPSGWAGLLNRLTALWSEWRRGHMLST